MLAATAAFPLIAKGQGGRPPVKADLVAGTLSFTARATTGAFVGSTSVVSGMVEGSLTNARGWVEAPVATLDTRNGLRDRDLRASMEAAKYPVMRFDLASVTVLSAADGGGDSVAVQLHGAFTIHGVTRAVDLPAVVSVRGDSAYVTAAFPLDVELYRVGGLTKMFGLLRMQRQIDVRVDLIFLSAVGTTSRAEER